MENSFATSADLLEPGSFVIGCNYWASHAGTAMWSDWRPDAVDADLQQLSEAGMQVLRVFPLWPDFQPITLLRTAHSRPIEFRLGERPLPDDDAGGAGVSPEAIDRFRQFADLADKHGLRLIVGLITGWMSGRLFVPPALEGMNPITDATAVMWEVRLVRHFVRQLGGHRAIIAWDLGNECNCMGHATREQSWLWTSTIVNAIRVEDRTRPVVSGMHSLSTARDGAWRISDQGELTDLLTTHPYPIFTPHCDRDAVNTIRAGLHAAAESRMYADVGGRPCLVEEVGTLGPMLASEAVAADFVRCGLLSSWANDCHGFLWWCAYDLDRLEHAPYDWDSYERELGLFRADRTPKPVLREMAAFRRFIAALPVRRLPPRTTQAVCVLTAGQDSWAAAFGAFVLAKQAGFDISFQTSEQPLRDSALYLVPCMSGAQSFSRRRWLELLDRVRSGATAYVSHNDAMLSPFVEPFGLEVVSRSRRVAPAGIRIDALPDVSAFSVGSPFRLGLSPTRAAVLGGEADGNPAFTCADYGRGRIYFLTVPIEQHATATPGGFDAPNAQPLWRIYRQIAEQAIAGRAVQKEHPQLGVTEHPLDARTRAVVVINYSPAPVSSSIRMAAGWRPAATWRGNPPAARAALWDIAVPANDGIAFTATGLQGGV